MYEVVYATVAVRLRGIRHDDERKGGGTMKDSMNDVPHPKKALWRTRGHSSYGPYAKKNASEVVPEQTFNSKQLDLLTKMKRKRMQCSYVVYT